MSLVGGSDYTTFIEDGRKHIKRSREALKILRHQISEAIRLNLDNAESVAFLTEQSAQLETISDANDELGIILEKLWKIGAVEKIERTKKKGEDDA